jgi:hypothetical protein
VLSLYRSLLSRLSKHSTNHEDNIKHATAILDRVNIMRVFDFEGIVEGLNELIDTLEGGKKLPKSTIVDSQEEEAEEVMLMDEEQRQEESKKEEKSTGMVLINNLSQVLGLLLKDNYARGMFCSPFTYWHVRGNLLMRNQQVKLP